MVMSTVLIESVKRRSVDEAERSAYPPGFPVLPGVPAARYVDADFARLEADAVFGRSRLFVAHTDQLAAPGDYLQVDQLGKPVILVRGDDARVRAFYNTCKHRGAALVSDGEGNTGRR
jgi:phenylpropionate dioxygenase-like ring-hydroxylating dioxygenase large terminal subunit